MGGGSYKSALSSSGQEASSSSSSQDSISESSISFYYPTGYGGRKNESKFRDLDCVKKLILEAPERQRSKVYDEIIKSYKNLPSRVTRFEEAKSKVLSYTPGSCIADMNTMFVSDEYDVPKTTSLMLIGPKGSGKSSLINKISAVLEDDVYGFGRAQISYNQPSGENGTYFLHEYMFPRNSGSFCLYDTRSLSDNSNENNEMIAEWMEGGVFHGKMVKRNSDNFVPELEARLRAKSRRKCFSYRRREVNFVIFVVNALDLLKLMVAEEEGKNQHPNVMAMAFDNPFLSFKDDKPVVVVTHGDLLSISDRAKIRLYLGELLLHVHPANHIFDIPDGDDPVTKLTVVEMLNYCLDRADRNLPSKEPVVLMEQPPFIIFVLTMIVLGAILFLNMMKH